MKSIIGTAAITESQYEDHKVWMDFRNGDREAFAILYHRYFSFLIQSSLRFSNDHDLVKDCIHDLFVEMWNKKITLGIPKSVRAYFYISVRRKIIRHLRRTRSRSRCINRVYMPEETEPTAEMKIMTEQERRLRHHDMYRSLEFLSKRQKEAIYLKYYANLSYPEIAGKMAISTDSIYNLVSKAIVTMQKQMAKNT